MREISDAPTAPPRPPGLYRWTGKEFLPAVGTWVGPMVLAVFGIVVAFFVGIGIGHAGSGSTTAVSQPAVSSVATVPASTPAPAPTPLALSGQGSKVVEFDLPQGSYKLAWTAQGHDNFIVDLEGSSESGLVNEIPPSPSSGETFVRLGGGHYALNVKASTLSWTMTWTKMG